MRLLIFAAVLAVFSVNEVTPTHLRPLSEPPATYDSDVPYINVYKPPSAYPPLPGSADTDTYYKGYESASLDYNRWRRSLGLHNRN
ncbi:hypothetical protein TcasGA2_TC003111 [Tribolium castaneum]|uniref:Uncharacterized protein n=1 Tax=Tribolium castaneum TaxID=7070 RepID=D6WFB1_TRICA|nr:hypothetical protein TcasGA2_TC003111 [Tribolium castaneum]